jgi:hypothetical protein
MTKDRMLLDSADEIAALADRIEQTPAYTGAELGCRLHPVDTPPGTANSEHKVILVNVGRRDLIVAALRAIANGASQ